jgi:hypothetical protein
VGCAHTHWADLTVIALKALARDSVSAVYHDRNDWYFTQRVDKRSGFVVSFRCAGEGGFDHGALVVRG